MNTKTKNSIKISGTFGDEVKLYLDGYVHTKYSDIEKIKSVNVEEHNVELYDGSTIDFGRISFSTPNSKESGIEYLKFLSDKLNQLKLKIDSIIVFKTDSEKLESHKIVDIIYPKLIDDNYFIKLVLENISTSTKITLLIDNIFKFQTTQLIKVEFTPYTLQEKLDNLLSEYSDYFGKISDTGKYKKELLRIIEEEINERTKPFTTII